ncbi:hypothetical protein CLV77_1332 [Brevirhabdus pacifica]|nr:hypothetical protein [Brevirhabdus pacifica]PJJ86775.1 hypothetical protein CLV77_1332 [Brevirhabdus pacifica]
MQIISSGYRGVALVLGLNLDRLLWLATIGGALALSAYIASL